MKAQTQPTRPARRILARSLIACLALSLAPAACMMEEEDELALMDMELDAEGEFELQLGEPASLLLVPQPMTPLLQAQLADNGVERIGDAWYDECNPCVLTEDGPACAVQACTPDAFAPSEPVECEGGLYSEGDVWEHDCNMCICTAQGSSCTIVACEGYEEREGDAVPCEFGPYR